MTSDNRSEPNVTLGDVSGSTFAIGSHAHAETRYGTAAPRSEETAQLLAAIRELRADLGRTRSSGGTAELDAALADTEDEITRTGSAGADRLGRLRGFLADANALTTVLTSAATLAGLLGR
ncbi:hypothetical protein [Streptomyces murinus]|uniref:Uncharacterized protein n=1 Tax=Streptomyces murinus TaxID=33900 RepID=A0A7W3NNH6_STRMR|nr:hypothetical protein [Streptomyces murinus]MBA9053799.1 hypothetical protein [Streptomyces murinus]UWW94887.1 hypothetical protein GO605_31645 [Streptomyces murinus]